MYPALPQVNDAMCSAIAERMIAPVAIEPVDVGDLPPLSASERDLVSERLSFYSRQV